MESADCVFVFESLYFYYIYFKFPFIMCSLKWLK